MRIISEMFKNEISDLFGFLRVISSTASIVNTVPDTNKFYTEAIVFSNSGRKCNQFIIVKPVIRKRDKILTLTSIMPTQSVFWQPNSCRY